MFWSKQNKNGKAAWGPTKGHLNSCNQVVHGYRDCFLVSCEWSHAAYAHIHTHTHTHTHTEAWIHTHTLTHTHTLIIMHLYMQAPLIISHSFTSSPTLHPAFVSFSFKSCCFLQLCSQSSIVVLQLSWRHETFHHLVCDFSTTLLVLGNQLL